MVYTFYILYIQNLCQVCNVLFINDILIFVIGYWCAIVHKNSAYSHMDSILTRSLLYPPDLFLQFSKCGI